MSQNEMLTMRSHSSPATAETEAKISQFGTLPDGWHYNEGVPANPDAAAMTRALLRYAVVSGFLTTDAFPGIEGEVRLTIYEGLHYLEFTTNADKTIDFVREEGGEEVESQESISFEEARERIDRLKEKIWPLSAQSTSDIGINASIDFRALFSQATRTDFPFSTVSAPSNEARIIVATLDASTEALPEARLVIGSSPTGQYLTIAASNGR